MHFVSSEPAGGAHHRMPVPAIRWSQLQERLERAGRGEAQTPTCVVTGCPFWEGGPCGSRM